MDISEQEILSQCVKGNLDNFSLLYDAYVKKIYNFIYFRTHHKETAEDLTSDAFTKEMGHIRTFNPKTGSFSSWLYRIARNTIIDYYRTKKVYINIEDVWDLHNAKDMASDVHIRISIEKVRTYLNRLSPQERNIILMRVWDQLSYKEISEILGKSEAACKMSYVRTMEKIRHHMPSMALLILILFRIVNKP